eukprot:COSAG01_NODE_49327_length_373_cov_0.751825_1_plen_54_part_10
MMFHACCKHQGGTGVDQNLAYPHQIWHYILQCYQTHVGYHMGPMTAAQRSHARA